MVVMVMVFFTISARIETTVAIHISREEILI